MEDKTATLKKFLGTGDNNQEGKSLKEFLDSYNPKLYDSPANTVDTLIFSYEGNLNHLKVLLIKRGNHPSIGFWALPGGFVEMDEELDEAAARELKEETGIEVAQVEQLSTYGGVDRDPRTRVITTAFIALINRKDYKVCSGDDAADAAWFTVDVNLINEYNREEKGFQVKDSRYHLRMANEEKNINLEAEVSCTSNLNGLLKNTKYKVIQTSQIAADHAAIITEGMHYIREIKELTKNGNK